MATANSEVRTIKARRDLQMKVGTGAIDDKIIDRAQKVITENKVDFAPLAKPYLDKLQAAVSDAKKGEVSDKELLDRMTTPIMNLKANAATFNYPFISDTTAVILMFIEQINTLDDEILKIVENLHKTVTLAIAHKIISTDNPAGAQLYKEFRNVCQRYTVKRLT